MVFSLHRNDDHEGYKVKPAVEKTLKDLGLDYIDLFLVWSPSDSDGLTLYTHKIPYSLGP